MRLLSLAAAVLLALSGATALARTPPTVWISPDDDTPDYGNLFAHPEQWATARSHVDVFKFPPSHLDKRPAAANGNFNDLVRLDAFRKLKQWGIDIAVEAPSVKEWDCTGVGGARLTTLNFIKAVASAGGNIKYVATDEPLATGPGACKLSLEETAARAASYAKQLLADKSVATDAPGLMVGDIEPYPSHSAEELMRWTRALEHNGYKPAFLHLDVDVNDVNIRGPKLNFFGDMQALQKFLRGEGIPFGIVFWPGKDPEPSDKAYFADVISYAKRIHVAIGKPDEMIFQSWVGRASARCVGGAHCGADNKFMCAPPDPPYCGKRSVPLNLPESGANAYTMTRLINETLAIMR
jgi:hypothetical protein